MQLNDRIKDILKENYESPKERFIGRWNYTGEGLIWDKCGVCHSRFWSWNLKFCIKYNFPVCNECTLLVYQYCREQGFGEKMPCYHCKGNKYINDKHCHYCDSSGLEYYLEYHAGANKFEQLDQIEPISKKPILIKSHACGDENIIDERAMGKDGVICIKCNKVIQW